METLKTRVLSIRQALAFAWPNYKKHWRLQIAVLFSMLVAWVALEIIVIAGHHLGILLWIFAHLAFLAVFASLQIGFLQNCLAIRDQREPAFAGAFAPLSLAIRFLGAEVLYLLMVAAGLALLLVPGIYLAARYAFFGFRLAEGAGIVQAFREAGRLASSAIPSLAATLMVVLLFNLLGAAILGIGLLITIPVSCLLLADLYRQFLPAVQAVDPRPA